jgi:hypothetical protein
MPLATLADKRARRAAHAAHRRALFPFGYVERVVFCRSCKRRGTVRDIPHWDTIARHHCPGPWTIGGFVENTR